MRVVQDEGEFSSYLLSVGDGTTQTYPNVGEDVIQIPQRYLVKTVDE